MCLQLYLRITLLFFFITFCKCLYPQSVTEEWDHTISENSENPYFGACNDNAYLNASDPATIEYDNMISGYHLTIVKEADGAVKVWGDRANSDGSHALSPIEVIPENGFDYEGEILKIGLGSFGGHGASIVLTSEGLYYWGSMYSDIFPLKYLDQDPTEQYVMGFSKILPTNTFGTEEVNPKSLPLNVEPEDVKMIFISTGIMTLTTFGGEVWEMRTNSYWYPYMDVGDGLEVWQRIHKSTTSDGNTDGGILTNIVAARGCSNTTMALTSDGEIYTWGGGTLLGDGSEALDRTMATQMQKPTPDFEVKQIGMTGGHFNHRTYYLLSTDGELYSLGGNNVGQLGDFTQEYSTHWVRVQKNEEGDPLPPIAWMSPNEHDLSTSSINALTFEGELWSWGSNSMGMLGADPEEDGFKHPFSGGGGTEGMSLFAVESGGHTTIVVDKCQARYGYVGHRINGSMGDGSAENGVELNYNFEDTGILNLCGAENAPAVTDLIICDGEMANLNMALINEDSENVKWFEDEELIQEVENPEEVEAGTYYVIFFNENGINCEDPIAAEVEVIIEDCPFAAIDDVFYLCAGENSAPQSIFDNDTLGENPENVDFYFEEELPDWLMIDDEGIIYISPSAPVGTYTFTYFIYDTENPDFEDSATITLIIEPFFEAVDDFAETDKGQAISINILENDLPEQEIPVDAISLIDPDTGNHVNDVNIPSEGTYVLDVNLGFVTFTPHNDFIGWTSSVEYVLENDCGVSEPGQIHVFVRNPQLEMTKSVDREIEYFHVGEVIEYEIILKNTGNITLYNIEVTDPNSDEINIGFIEELQPEESQDFIATHTLTQADVEAGFVANMAFAVGETEHAVEVSISSYDPNPLDDLPDPDCAECTFVIITPSDSDEEEKEECYLKVSEGVSPNGDGKNDYLKIDTGACEGKIRIKIYNRWGMVVFSSDNYGLGNEVFEGYANGSGIVRSSEKLPSATYYYVAEMKTEEGNFLKKTGYFYLLTF